MLYFCLRDYFLLREIGVMTALRRKFWWARYNLWADDLPEDSLVVLEGNDLLIDTDAIARHVLRQSKARIIYQDRFRTASLRRPGDSDFETKSFSFSTRTIRTCNFHMLLVCVCLHVRTKCCCYYNATRASLSTPL